MEKIITLTNYLFDPLHFFWEHKVTKQFLASILVLVFICSLILIEANKMGFLPNYYPWSKLPSNPFWAVHLAFSLLLLVEVISFIFVLPCSMSKAVGKQIEILSLIFLRSCFKRLTEFNEPVNFSNHLSTILEIGAYGLSALLIYVILFFYYRVLSRQTDRDDSLPGHKLFYFVGGKKLISLVLFLIFVFLSGYNIYAYFTSHTPKRILYSFDLQ